MGEDVPLAGHSQKSVRQDAEHSRRDADAPQELPDGKMGGAAKGVRKNNSRAIEKFPDFGNRGRCLSPHLGHRERASFKPGQM